MERDVDTAREARNLTNTGISENQAFAITDVIHERGKRYVTHRELEAAIKDVKIWCLVGVSGALIALLLSLVRLF